MNTTHIRESGRVSGTVEQFEAVQKRKYCLYARKSTESEERQVLSIDSQISEMLKLAERDGMEVVEIRRESHSAKNSSERPVFNSMLVDIREQKFNAILTWAPDRLSRNAGDLGSLVDLMDQKLLLDIRTYGQAFSNSPNEKFLLMILCSQAKLENDNRGINIKRGLRTRAEMGLWPTTPATGYLIQKDPDKKCRIIPDPERAGIIKKMFEKCAYEKWSGRRLYHWLKFEINFRTKSNHHLALSNIYIILQNHIYYGVFEWPQKSGNWFNGKHEPLITKELFDQVQDQLKRDRIVRETREFAFTKLIGCGHCGSGITADEKYKKLKDGTVSKYIYYGCTRSKDLHCKGGYLREEELITQLVGIIDQLDVNEFTINHKFKEEVARYQKFNRIMLGGTAPKLSQPEIDIRSYAKYLLKEGSISEKRELLSCIKSRMVIRNKAVQIQTISD